MEIMRCVKFIRCPIWLQSMLSNANLVRLKFWPRSKKRSGDEAYEISRGFAANSHSTSTAAPPPNLTRLAHNTASYAGYTGRRLEVQDWVEKKVQLGRHVKFNKE